MTPKLAYRQPLAPLTTLGVGGPAAALCRPASEQALAAALALAHREGLPVTVLGGGSNVVVADRGLPGLTVQPALCSLRLIDMGAGSVRVVAEGGLLFDTVVATACAAGLWGIEALSGIPGTVGAAPVQNIGAYGQSLGDCLVGVRAQPIEGGPVRWLPKSELGLGYRASRLKGGSLRLIVTAVELVLRRAPVTGLHEQVAARLAATGGAASSPAAVREAVLAIRASKGMLWPGDPPAQGNAGSFFVNPTLPAAQAAGLLAAIPGLPCYPSAHGTKVAAAALIEAAGLLRGHVFAESAGRTGLSAHHALCIVNRGGATAKDVLLSARTVQRAVWRAFRVFLRPEVRRLGFARSGGSAAAAP